MNFFKGSKRESFMGDEAIEMKQPDQDYELIIKTAIELFMIKELEDVSFQEIAENSGLLVSQINKFFSTKTELIFAVGYHFLSPQYSIDEMKIQENLNGLDAVEQLFDEKVRLMIRYPERYRFLDRLERFMLSDAYILHNNQEEQKRYEQSLRSSENTWKVYMIAGINDHSIRSDIDITKCIQTFSLVILNFFRTVTMHTATEDISESIYIKEMVHIIKDMMRCYLKA